MVNFINVNIYVFAFLLFIDFLYFLNHQRVNYIGKPSFELYEFIDVCVVGLVVPREESDQGLGQQSSVSLQVLNVLLI